MCSQGPSNNVGCASHILNTANSQPLLYLGVLLPTHLGLFNVYIPCLRTLPYKYLC